MRASAEISMYPLNPNYGTDILKFIASLRAYDGLEITSNTMSTQIFGDYNLIMDAIRIETLKAFRSEEAIAMVIKLVNLDLKP
jgi:uncharacterized protein YqgV (UPF0045/DUF77 family)